MNVHSVASHQKKAQTIWTLFARSFRNVRAMGAALAFVIAIIAMSSLRCNPMLEKVNVPGVVITIEAVGLHPFNEGEAMSRVLVATPDSSKVRLFLPPPVPLPGDIVPLVVEHYKKGNSMYYLDQLKWRMDGPG